MKNLRGFVLGVLISGIVAICLAPSQVNYGGVEAPPGFGFSITPNDSVDLSQVTRSIWVGVGGDVCVRYAGNDADLVLKNVPSGSRVPGRFSRIKAAGSGTTATNIIGEY